MHRAVPTRAHDGAALASAETRPPESPAVGIGHDEVVRRLYAEHAGPLLAFVLRLTGGDWQRAEDVVQ
jgi:RNA polymerase sigma-70 factor, ECF subfamily